eukprot:TRINITY_DN21698_c0_g1_i2.p1 TRINITY_DN21698_c0_g1~~TRINITY_DN21698_c0_g1_i2.p1  ORF type:complete len:341 (+),score=62.24 TRINITY_DN21698_c0_g1_i2:644-1666(+)
MGTSPRFWITSSPPRDGLRRAARQSAVPALMLLCSPELLPRPLAGAFFWSPWTNLMCNTEEYYHHAFAKIVDTSGMKKNEKARPNIAYVGDIIFQGHPNQNRDWFTANAEGYVGSNYSLLTDPVASPFYAQKDHLGGGGIPPLYFAVGGSESILGDSVVVAQKASMYGNDVHLDVYTGMWHVFPMYAEGCGSGKALWQAEQAQKKTVAFIQRAASDYWRARKPSTSLAESFLAAQLPTLGAASRTTPARSHAQAPWTLINYARHTTARETKLMDMIQSTEGFTEPLTLSEPVTTYLAPDRLAERCGVFLLGAVSTLLIQAVFQRWRQPTAAGTYSQPLLN